MNPGDDVPESVRSTLDAMQKTKEVEPYGLAGRLITFGVIAVVGSVVVFSFLGRYAIGAAMSAGGGSHEVWPIVLFVGWILALVGIGSLVFKK